MTTVILAMTWRPADAHPLTTTAVLLDLHADHVDMHVQLPLAQLGTALNEPLTPRSASDPATLSRLREYVRAHTSATDETGLPWSSSFEGGSVQAVDGVEHLVLDGRLEPQTATIAAFTLQYDAIVERLISHRIFVAARNGASGDYASLGMLSWQAQSLQVQPSASAASSDGGFASAIGLGAGHIGEGSDHLLFLIMLLLPAPLLARGRRWLPGRDLREAAWRVVHVVSAFAVGHSITLVVGAAGLINLPVRTIEAGIALSVLVSALHAARPLVQRGEIMIATGFGLLHGMAFATVLSNLKLSRGDLIQNLLGFNVGIELTQLAVVALLMPSLAVLSRTGYYTVVRLTLAAMGTALSVAWLAQRLGMLSRNPLEPVADVLVEHPLLLAAALGALAIGAMSVPRSRTLAGACAGVQVRHPDGVRLP